MGLTVNFEDSSPKSEMLTLKKAIQALHKAMINQDTNWGKTHQHTKLGNNCFSNTGQSFWGV